MMRLLDDAGLATDVQVGRRAPEPRAAAAQALSEHPTPGNTPAQAAPGEPAHHDRIMARLGRSTTTGAGRQAAFFFQAEDGIRDGRVTGVQTCALPISCASCHSGAHTPFAEQWAASGHNDSAGMATPASQAACQSCHEGKAAILKFNGNQHTRFLDSTGTKTIVCVVCHDPHGSNNVAQLRAPIDVPDPSRNLCMQCHLRNATPTPSFTRGGRSAHSSQGPILLGEGAGWMPPGFYFDSAGAYS